MKPSTGRPSPNSVAHRVYTVELSILFRHQFLASFSVIPDAVGNVGTIGIRSGSPSLGWRHSMSLIPWGRMTASFGVEIFRLASQSRCPRKGYESPSMLRCYFSI